MKKRLEALERIERLQKQMHDLEVWRLAALDRERRELTEDHRAMLAAIGGAGVAAFGPPAAAAMRHIRALERRIAAAEAEHAAQTRRAIHQGARAKLADRARESVDARYRDQQRRKELAELIERSLGASKSSPA